VLPRAPVPGRCQLDPHAEAYVPGCADGSVTVQVGHRVAHQAEPDMPRGPICYDLLYIFKGARSAPGGGWPPHRDSAAQVTLTRRRCSIGPQLVGRDGETVVAGRRRPSFGPGGPRRRRRALPLRRIVRAAGRNDQR